MFSKKSTTVALSMIDITLEKDASISGRVVDT